MRVFTPFDEHHPDFFARVKMPPREHHFTGTEQGIVAQTYFAEDEPTFDVDITLDTVAFDAWRDHEIDREHDLTIAY